MGLDTKIRIGVLFPHDPGALERVFVVQDSVMVGESFTVAVYTVGSGRCTRVVRHQGRLRWSYFVGQSEGDLKVDSDGLQSPRGPA